MNPDITDAAFYLHYFSNAITALAHPPPSTPSPSLGQNQTSKAPTQPSKPASSSPPNLLSDFPPLPTLSKKPPIVHPQPRDSQSAKKKRLRVYPTAENSPQPALPQFHAQCIRQCPRLLSTAVLALISAIRICSSQKITHAVAGHPSGEAIINHAADVFACISNLLPYPLLVSLSTLRPLSHLSTSLPPFPVPSGTPWTPPLALTLTEEDPSPLSQRLISKLEIAWDATLTLQRRFRGDFGTYPAGTFDALSAARTLSDLHPASIDAYAARFVQLISAASLTSADGRMRRLGARMRAGEGRKDKEAVVLHRLPAVVRGMFEDPAQAFFLEFLTGVDSARLNAALTPRLARAVAKAIYVAAGATSNAAFSEAVVDARLFAKLLCVTLNAANWAHSEYAMSGGGEGQGLSLQALQGRIEGHEAAWMASFDVTKVLLSALENGGPLALFASVAVGEVVMKLCAVDPVAREGRWYRKALTVLKELEVRSRGMGRFPLLYCMLVDLVDGDLCGADVARLKMDHMKDRNLEFAEDEEGCAGIGDARLMSECCPGLEVARRAIETQGVQEARNPPNPKRPTRRIQPMVATGTEKINEKDAVESMLKREFVRRMDGKLRELIGVVAIARAGNAAGAEKAYARVAKLLYPDSAETVVDVASRLCGERSRSMGAKGTQRSEVVSKVPSAVQNGRLKDGPRNSEETGRRMDALEKRLAAANVTSGWGSEKGNQKKMESLESRLGGVRGTFSTQGDNDGFGSGSLGPK